MLKYKNLVLEIGRERKRTDEEHNKRLMTKEGNRDGEVLPNYLKGLSKMSVCWLQCKQTQSETVTVAPEICNAQIPWVILLPF